jgi:zinc protease
MRTRAVLLAGLLAAGAAAPCAAQSQPQRPQPQLQDRLPHDPHVVMGQLPNGLRYFIRENRRPEKRAELRLVVNAGSILEDEKQLGLAHFVEHMAFNGTRSFARQELVGYLESIGMRFGADLNAYTSFDETVYMLQVPTDSAGPLETGVQILEEWAHAVAFDPAEIDRERGVVVEEWRLGQGAGERLRQQYFPVLFRDSRYAERLPIGRREVLEGFDHADLVRFYRDWYRPDLMAVVAVGDFDARAVERMIRERFGGVPAAPAAAPPRAAFEVPDHGGTLVAIATDREATGTSVEVDWKLEARPHGTLAALRDGLARSLYTRMLNARLAELAQRPDPPFIGAGASYGSLIRTRDIHSLGASVQDGGVVRGLEAVLTEAERVARHGFTSTELERHRTNLLRAYERAHAERANTESGAYAGQYVDAFLNARAVPGIEFEYEQVQRLLPGVALDEVNALARQWMREHSRVVIITAPEHAAASLPDRDAVLGVFARVAAAQVAPYADIVADAPLVPVLPTPGRVQRREPVPGIDAEKLTLANGIEVYVKRTAFKDDQVLFAGFSPGGLSLVSDGDFPSGIFAGTLVSISGVGELDQIQLGKALTGKAARVSFGVGDTGESVSGTASPRDVETMLQLAYMHFTAPRNDSAAFESYMTRLRGALANRGASPESALQDTLEVTRWQYHARAQPVDPAFLDRIDRGTAYRIFRERFAHAGDFAFVLVGAVTDEHVALLETYIGGLPVRTGREQPRDVGMRHARGVVEKVVRRGVEPKSETHMVFTGPADYTRENRLLLSVLTGVLDMRLRDVLREDLGGTYGVGVGGGMQRLPEPGYTVEVQFGAAPERLEELTRAVFAEIERLQAQGPDVDALAKVKEQQRRGWETNLQRNEYWLSVLMRQVETGEAAGSVMQFAQQLDAVTAAEVQTAAQRFLDTRHYVRVTLVPER